MTPLTDIRQIPQSVLMAKTGQELMRLMEKVSVDIEQLMQAQQWLHQAVTEKYAFYSSQLRQEQQQAFGDLQFECNGVEVTQSVPRRVTWDQKKLRAIAQCIREQGEDPEEFMDLTYSIPEERFDYWPPVIQRAFEAAVTIEAGQPRYALKSVLFREAV